MVAAVVVDHDHRVGAVLERGEPVAAAGPRGAPRALEVQVAQGDGSAGVPIVELEPIGLAGHAVGDPLVDRELTLRRESNRSYTCAAGRRDGQLPGRPHHAQGVVGHLHAKREGIDANSTRVLEGERTALGIESEARVQPGNALRAARTESRTSLREPRTALATGVPSDVRTTYERPDSERGNAPPM